jgi:hypothetical protein
LPTKKPHISSSLFAESQTLSLSPGHRFSHKHTRNASLTPKRIPGKANLLHNNFLSLQTDFKESACAGDGGVQIR